MFLKTIVIFFIMFVVSFSFLKIRNNDDFIEKIKTYKLGDEKYITSAHFIEYENRIKIVILNTFKL